jgi:hypothetical protein
MKTKLLILGLVFIALATLANAQNSSVSSLQSKSSTEKASTFVDANNNGICDYYENNVSNASNCRRSGANNCCGLGRRQMQGQGNGSGRGRNRSGLSQGKGRGRNFVDTDKNGICDNSEASKK